MNRQKHSPKPRSCQKLEKSIFNTFSIGIWIEKSFRQKQDLAKSCKNQFFNTFLIRIWGGRVGRQYSMYLFFLPPKNWKNKYLPGQKQTLHAHWKNNSVSKKRIHSYEKRPQNRLAKCRKPKNQTLSWKIQFCLKKTYKFIWKKGNRTVFQNAWSQKNQHFHWKKHSVPNKTYKFIWKKATEPSSKIPEAKKTTLSLKKQFFFLMLINSYARAQNRLAKCRKPKNQTLSLKMQFCLKKAYKFIWKKATEPSSKMPEAKKTNTFIEKNILFQTKLINPYEKRPQNRLPKYLKPKKQHSHWKNNSFF